MFSLIGLHAALGEIGALAFLWVFVEMLGAGEGRVRRAYIVALIGALFLFAAWIVGGFYYVEVYGAAVKPVIKEGPQPWAHKVMMETKEHLFLFIPVLALTTVGLISRYKNVFSQNKKARYAALVLSMFVVLLAFAMAGMGFLVTSGFRAALESSVL